MKSTPKCSHPARRRRLQIDCLAILFGSVLGLVDMAHPGLDAAEDLTGIRMTNERTLRIQIGAVVRAPGQASGIVATMPVPMPWPEQDVKTVDEQVSQNVRSVQSRILDGGVQQMVVTIPQLAAGAEAVAIVTLEITKRDIVAPESTAPWTIPKRVPRQLSKYLGSSPYIDTQDREIRRLAAEVVADDQTAWQLAEAIYDCVREKVEYRFDEKIKDARVALDDGFGDCEELTSLFIALCRIHKIPARAVWVPGHCYPEFYLEDDQGKGQWFPCQAAGARSFGAMSESRPILQKGDNFRVPGSRKPQRYIRQALTAKHATANPDVRFIEKLLEIP